MAAATAAKDSGTAYAKGVFDLKGRAHSSKQSASLRQSTQVGAAAPVSHVPIGLVQPKSSRIDPNIA